MNNISEYIIEKLKLDKDSTNSNNFDEIISTIKHFFKDNDAFNDNVKEIEKFFDKLSDILDNDIDIDEEYNIICADYDDYKDYIKKFKINASSIRFVNTDKMHNILTAFFNGNEDKEMTLKYKKGKQYINIYESDFIIWIDSGLKGNDYEDVLTICIIPKYEL